MFNRLRRDRYFSDGELAAFLAAVRERRHVHTPRNHALFTLLANTGIRPSEALALTRRDVHLHAPQPWIRVRRKKKKGPDFDDLLLTPALAAVLEKRLAGMWPDQSWLFPIQGRAAQRLFHHYARMAGIERRCNLYMLRHTAATRIYRSTRDIRIVQALLGHSKPDVTAIYTHVSFPVLADAANRMEPAL
jgi:integrase/recombinase XerD